MSRSTAPCRQHLHSCTGAAQELHKTKGLCWSVVLPGEEDPFLTGPKDKAMAALLMSLLISLPFLLVPIQAGAVLLTCLDRFPQVPSRAGCAAKPSCCCC